MCQVAHWPLHKTICRNITTPLHTPQVEPGGRYHPEHNADVADIYSNGNSSGAAPAPITAEEILSRSGIDKSDLPTNRSYPVCIEFQKKHNLTFTEVSILSEFASSPMVVKKPICEADQDDFSFSPAHELQGCLNFVKVVSVEEALVGPADPGECLLDILDGVEFAREQLLQMCAVHAAWLTNPATRPTVANFIDLEQLLAIRLYTASDCNIKIYALVNRILNHRDRFGLEAIRPFIKILIRGLRAMDAAGCGRTTQAYRGVKVAANDALRLKYDTYKQECAEGKSRKSVFEHHTPITFAAFTSVSLSESESERYGDSVFFQFMSVKGIDLSTVSVFPQEKELLVPPPAVFKVSGTYYLRGVLTIQLTQVEQENAFYLGDLISLPGLITNRPPVLPADLTHAQLWEIIRKHPKLQDLIPDGDLDFHFRRPESGDVTTIWYRYNKVYRTWYWTPYRERSQDDWISVDTMTVPRGFYKGQQPHAVNQAIIRCLRTLQTEPVDANVRSLMHEYKRYLRPGGFSFK
jgi:hypothetical protein